MLKPIHLAIVSTLLPGCGSHPPSSREPSGPSAAAARFASEEAGRPDAGAARLRVRDAARVSLPDGRLAVSDAFVNDAPIVISGLPRGDFAVEVLVATSGSDERVAAARLRVRTDPIARWSRAGFIAIDSGTAAFFDPRVSAAITPSNVQRFSETLENALSDSAPLAYSTAGISWEGMTVVAFSTGFGDGSYPVFLGASAAGLPAAILVDLPSPRGVGVIHVTSI